MLFGETGDGDEKWGEKTQPSFRDRTRSTDDVSESTSPLGIQAFKSNDLASKLEGIEIDS